MFDLLKKKINSFTAKVKEKVEKKAEELPAEEEPEIIAEEAEEIIETPAEEKAEEIVEKPAAKEKAIPAAIEKPVARELKAKISVKGKLKAVISGKIIIEEKDLSSLLDDLQLALLEADVEQETAEKIAGEIKAELVGKKISKKELDSVLRKEIKSILERVMQAKQLDLLQMIEEKEEKPFVILFLGPNGAGKTTSMGKLTHLLQEKGKRIVWAAADTFRAASIEQLENHAEKLGVRVVKHRYGADPAAVAFDAVASAKAKKIDCVMIDSAGRQETNRNLMEELKKIDRVIKPDLKIFVGEALAGHALVQQAEEFDKHLQLHGFILTKIDTDAKGGSTISLLYKLHKPVLYIGTGQEYKDLLRFEPEFIIERVVA